MLVCMQLMLAPLQLKLAHLQLMLVCMQLKHLEPIELHGLRNLRNTPALRRAPAVVNHIWVVSTHQDANPKVHKQLVDC